MFETDVFSYAVWKRKLYVSASVCRQTTPAIPKSNQDVKHKKMRFFKSAFTKEMQVSVLHSHKEGNDEKGNSDQIRDSVSIWLIVPLGCWRACSSAATHRGLRFS